MALSTLTDVLTDALLATQVPVYQGKSYLSLNDAPPRVVVLPTADTFSGARQGSSPPRSLKTCRSGAKVVIYGLNVDAVEVIRAAVVVALMDEMGTVFALGAGVWHESADESELGEVYELEVHFDVPMTEPADREDEVQPTSTSSALDVL